MDKTQHTPGPWTVSTTETKNRTLVEVMDANNFPIAHVYNAGTAYGVKYTQPMQANARLLAQAPILLEALERAEQALRNPDLSQSELNYEAGLCHDAIAKALEAS